MAADAMRAAKAAMASQAAAPAQPGADGPEPAASPPGEDGGEPWPPGGFDALLRELVDQRTYPKLYRLAWTPGPDHPPSEREEFLFGVDLILDGVHALIDRARRGAG
jgi:hypothetical protein